MLILGVGHRAIYQPAKRFARTSPRELESVAMSNDERRAQAAEHRTMEMKLDVVPDEAYSAHL